MCSKGFEDFIYRVSDILQLFPAATLVENLTGDGGDGGGGGGGGILASPSGSGAAAVTADAAAARATTAARGRAASSFRARPLTARRDAVLIELLVIYMPSYHQEQLPQITVDIILSCGDELMRCVPLWKHLVTVRESNGGGAGHHTGERLALAQASLANATASRLRVITGAAPMLHLPFSNTHGHVEDILTTSGLLEHQQQQGEMSPADPSFLVFHAAWVESLMRHLVDLVWITRETGAQAWCVDALRLFVNARRRVKLEQARRAREGGNEVSPRESDVRLPRLPIAEVSQLMERDGALHARVLGVLPECRDTADVGAGWA